MIEKLALIGFIGMAFTGWWAYDVKWAYTLFALMVVPLVVRMCFDMYKMGRDL